MPDFDLIVRGGTLVDGTGAAPREADVAIVGDVIRQIGRVAGRARRELDASGLLVTPGFVDIHTHYDGQALWSSALTPSSVHGVTTAVMGNCGVGFAPCRPDDQARLIELMEGVEDIPGAVLAEGIDWAWESFPQYLDALETRAHDIDFAAQLPHGALRLYAMGARGAAREAATEADCALMSQLTHEAASAGALGFSTSRTLNHRSKSGEPTPSLDASEAELTAIALGLSRAGRGVLQVVSDFKHPSDEFAMLRRVAQRCGRPLSISIAQHPRQPERYRELLALIAGANAEGTPIVAQVCGRAVGLVLGLEGSLHPFVAHPAYRELARLPLPERCAQLRDPELRRALEQALPDSHGAPRMLQQWSTIFVLDAAHPDYEPPPEHSVAARAAALGQSPAAFALDVMLRHEGRGQLYLPILNYAGGSLDACLEMLQHPNAVPGLGDGGAHVGMICDASLPTFMLTHWTRDRSGARLSLPWVIAAQSARTARAVGLLDRGVLAPGYKADLNLIDYDRLTLHAPEFAADLPAGGKRLLQRADGYVATVVSGEVIYEHGQATGHLPGKLVRGPRSTPA